MIPDIPFEAWRPGIPGWSEDILPFYERVAKELAPDAKVAEIGVCHGRSAVFLAEQLVGMGKHEVELWCIDWWKGDDFRAQIMTTLGKRTNVRDEVLAMLRLVRTDDRAARMFDDNSLDFVFIDADHSYEGMRTHLSVWGPKIKSGGILAGHDCDEPDWPGVRKAVDAYFGVGKVARPTRSVWEFRYPQHGATG